MVSIIERVPAEVHSGISFWALIFLTLSFATPSIYALIGHNGSMISYVNTSSVFDDQEHHVLLTIILQKIGRKHRFNTRRLYWNNR
jgi:hypothetical protein